MAWDKKIPFMKNRSGGLSQYREGIGDVLVDNFVFRAKLKFSHIGYKHIAFEENNNTYNMFMSEFSKVIPYMVNGYLEGDFTFRKQGQMYSLEFLIPEGV